MGKMYVEPSGYFTESMKKILEEGENKKSPKTKKRITIDDKEISRIALGIDGSKKTNKKH
ncbi:MAG: hypothetical protein J5687_06020 [Treponema sp.]|nr:hypothetical protein [Treponema sp.]